MPRTALLCALALAFLPAPEAAAQRAACQGGFAQPGGSTASYACSGVDFMGRVSLSQMGASGSNDIWGWTDPQTGDEYALVGLGNGTGFVKVTEPEAPVYLGKLPGSSSIWRDIKVYADHAFVVSEAGGYGMQVFDLTQLRDVSEPTTFSTTARYDGVGAAHNVVINEATGFAYIVGADDGSESGCSGGLHMVDVRTPASPAFAGCFAEDGYTHDAQCVVYDGPDADYAGREVCFAFNADTVTLVDVTDKAAPTLIASAIYPMVGYTHQGWLTEDRRFLIGNDEADESTFGIDTRTLVFDVADLDAPEFRGAFTHGTSSIDHNLYVRGRYVYESNYTSGLRILDAAALLGGGGGSGLEAAAFFDTFPENDAVGFSGTWSNYPFFASGNVVVNDGRGGLFIVRPQLGADTSVEGTQPGSFELTAAYPNPFTTTTRLTLRVGDAQTVRVEVYDVLGRRVAEPFRGVLTAADERVVVFDGTGMPAGTYLVRVTGERFAETRQVTLTR